MYIYTYLYSHISYIYTCIYIYTHLHTYTHIHTYIHMYMLYIQYNQTKHTFLIGMAPHRYIIKMLFVATLLQTACERAVTVSTAPADPTAAQTDKSAPILQRKVGVAKQAVVITTSELLEHVTMCAGVENVATNSTKKLPKKAVCRSMKRRCSFSEGCAAKASQVQYGLIGKEKQFCRKHRQASHKNLNNFKGRRLCQVSICIYMFMHLHIRICIYICVYIHICNEHMFTYIYVYLYVCM